MAFYFFIFRQIRIWRTPPPVLLLLLLLLQWWRRRSIHTADCCLVLSIIIRLLILVCCYCHYVCECVCACFLSFATIWHQKVPLFIPTVRNNNGCKAKQRGWWNLIYKLIFQTLLQRDFFRNVWKKSLMGKVDNFI